jgi:hypothetical protein
LHGRNALKGYVVAIGRSLEERRAEMNTRKISERLARSGKPVSEAHAGVVLLGWALCFAVLIWAIPGSVFAGMTEAPRSFSLPDKALEQVDLLVMQPIDRDQLLAEDRKRAESAEQPGPLRFAVSERVDVNLRNSGTWHALPDGRLWRLRIRSPGAVNNNLGITHFDLPAGVKLWIYDPSGKYVNGPYTSRNRDNKGGLWTPVIPGNEIVVELFVPSEASRAMLTIGQVNKGYRGLGKEGADKSGACNIDVVCPEGNPWHD